ncbi:MAG: response regulator [Pseudobdellovibrionaceae bacterium]
MEHKPPLVLLVDDDANDEELAQIALAETNIPHHLVIKRDGAQALQWIEEERTKGLDLQWPHLILLDLKLPKVTGFEVLQTLRSDQLTKNIPVVIFTSSLEEQDLAKCYDSGANAYIRKPIDFKEYRKTIGDMARFWICHNQSPPRNGLEGLAE